MRRKFVLPALFSAVLSVLLFDAIHYYSEKDEEADPKLSKDSSDVTSIASNNVARKPGAPRNGGSTTKLDSHPGGPPQEGPGSKHQNDEELLSPFSPDYFDSVNGIGPYDLANSDYASYSSDQLASMAEEGDVKAMQILGIRLLTENEGGDSNEKAKHFLNKAIIHGATHYPISMLAEKAGLKLRLASRGKIELSKEVERRQTIEMFSYYRLAERLGNPHLDRYFSQYYDREYQVVPTEQERATITKKANAMYSSVVERRKQLGLE